MKKALIFGITGQDGYFLSKYLFDRAVRVYGASRTESLNNKFKIVYKTDLSKDSVVSLIKSINPDYIFNLAGESSVGNSFVYPFVSYDIIVSLNSYILEAIKKCAQKEIRYFFSGSAEVFGPGKKDLLFSDMSIHVPISPYALGKSHAIQFLEYFKNINGIHASVGYLFNHESIRRNKNFVTQKIVLEGQKIKNGESSHLELGDISVIRDWGWAEEYMVPIFRLVNLKDPENIVIATGRSESLEYFVKNVFLKLGLNSDHYVISNNNCFRPNEIHENYADTSKAKQLLDWEAKLDIDDVINYLIG